MINLQRLQRPKKLRHRPTPTVCLPKLHPTIIYKQIPMMEDVFGSGVLGHLSSVGKESDDLRELVHRELFRPVWDKAVMHPLGMRLDVEPYRWASWRDRFFHSRLDGRFRRFETHEPLGSTVRSVEVNESSTPTAAASRECLYVLFIDLVSWSPDTPPLYIYIC